MRPAGSGEGGREPYTKIKDGDRHNHIIMPVNMIDPLCAKMEWLRNTHVHELESVLGG